MAPGACAWRRRRPLPAAARGWLARDRQVDASGRIAQGEDNTGVFIYQSMSGRGPTCAFEGAITMVPGSITQPTGDEFEVAVARFPLEAGPESSSSEPLISECHYRCMCVLQRLCCVEQISVGVIVHSAARTSAVAQTRSELTNKRTQVPRE